MRIFPEETALIDQYPRNYQNSSELLYNANSRDGFYAAITIAEKERDEYRK